MEAGDNRRLAVTGGTCGIAGTLFYILAVAVPMPGWLSYLLGMGWPILSIVFAYCLYRLIAVHNDGIMNRLAFLFACIGFSVVATMISVQFAIRTGMAEFMSATIPGEDNLLGIIKRSVRLVDMGMDVAWDFFIGTSLICLAVALSSHPRFGRAWGLASALAGAGLITLNVATFPWPPNSRGLIDLGPFIGLFIILLGSRMLLLSGGTAMDKNP